MFLQNNPGKKSNQNKKLSISQSTGTIIISGILRTWRRRKTLRVRILEGSVIKKVLGDEEELLVYCRRRLCLITPRAYHPCVTEKKLLIARRPSILAPFIFSSMFCMWDRTEFKKGVLVCLFIINLPFGTTCPLFTLDSHLAPALDRALIWSCLCKPIICTKLGRFFLLMRSWCEIVGLKMECNAV